MDRLIEVGVSIIVLLVALIVALHFAPDLMPQEPAELIVHVVSPHRL